MAGGRRGGQPPRHRAPLRAAFATPELRRCQLTTATSRTVDLAMLVAVSVALFDRGGTAAVATFGVVSTVVPAVASPVVTAVAGRMAPGRGLAVIMALGGVGIAATSALVATTGPVAAILATAAASKVAVASLRPLATALLPGYLRRPEELVATNTAAAAVDAVATLAGPALAGVALTTTGPATVLVACASLLVLVALVVLTLGGSAAPLTKLSRLPAEVVAGVRALVARGPLRLVTALVGVQCVVRGALNVIVVGLAIERLQLGDAGVGLLLGAVGLGGFLGIPVAARVAGSGHVVRTLGVGLALWGLPLVGVGLTVREPLVLALLAVVGVANALVDIGADTLLQRLAPPGRLAVVFGSFEALLFGAMAIGSAVAGLLLRTVDSGVAVMVAGALLPLAVAAAAVPLVRLDRSMHHRDAAVTLLQLNGIFSPLVLSAVDHVAGATETETHAAGAVIIDEGDVGDRFYVIESGDVEVVRGGDRVAELGAGECFGEVALLDGAPRNAAVVARTPVVTRSLDGEAFLTALRNDDRSRGAAERLAGERRPVGPPPGHSDHTPPDGPADDDSR